MRKFFDANWIETAPKLASYAVDLELNDDGTVAKHTIYYAEGVKASPEEAASEALKDLLGG